MGDKIHLIIRIIPESGTTTLTISRSVLVE
jgi:hypothetical protein